MLCLSTLISNAAHRAAALAPLPQSLGDEFRPVVAADERRRWIEAVSSGHPFLEQLQTKQGRVLYFQADECEEVTEIRRRLMGLPQGAYSIRYCSGLIDEELLLSQINSGA